MAVISRVISLFIEYHTLRNKAVEHLHFYFSVICLYFAQFKWFYSGLDVEGRISKVAANHFWRFFLEAGRLDQAKSQTWLFPGLLSQNRAPHPQAWWRRIITFLCAGSVNCCTSPALPYTASPSSRMPLPFSWRRRSWPTSTSGTPSFPA